MQSIGDDLEFAMERSLYSVRKCHFREMDVIL